MSWSLGGCLLGSLGVRACSHIMVDDTWLFFQLFPLHVISLLQNLVSSDPVTRHKLLVRVDRLLKCTVIIFPIYKLQTLVNALWPAGRL